MIAGHPLLSAAWAILLTLTLIVLITDYMRRGPISLRSYYVYVFLVFPILMQYPFLLDREQLDAIGPRQSIYEQTIVNACAIAFTGCATTYLGFAVAALLARKSYLTQQGSISYNIVRFWAVLPSTLALFIFVLMVYIVLLASGMPLTNARGAVFLNATLRPVFNLWYVLIPICTIFICTAAVIYRKRALYLGVVAMLIMGLSSGSRSTTIISLMQLLLIAAMLGKRNPRALFVAVSGIAMLLGAQFISMARGDGAVSNGNFLASFIYGNTFSDLRDLGWVLTGYNGTSLHGLTYVSGILTGIPGLLSEVRDQFRLGIVTVELAGFHLGAGEFHAGLRPTIFGEAYLNFGYLGVAAISIIAGAWIQRVQMAIDSARDERPEDYMVIVTSSLITISFIQCWLISAAFFRFYILIILAIPGTIARLFRR